MATATINGVVFTFERDEADLMYGLATRLQETKRTPLPAPIQVQPLPPAAEPVTVQQPQPAAQTPRPRGRPRKLTGNPALENAVRTLELMLQHGRLSMDAVIAEFGLSSKLSIGGIATSVRNSAVEVNFASTDAYRVETSPNGKVWIPTARTKDLLQALRAKLAEAQRTS